MEEKESLEIEILKLNSQISLLRNRLGNVMGFIRFLESHPDPSHAFRSPLVSVKSFLSILEMTEYKISEDDLQGLAKDVNASVDVLLNIIQEIFKEN